MNRENQELLFKHMGHVKAVLDKIPIPAFVLDLEHSKFLYQNENWIKLEKRYRHSKNLLEIITSNFLKSSPDNPMNINLGSSETDPMNAKLGWISWEVTGSKIVTGMLDDRTELLELNKALDDHRAILEMTLSHVQLGTWYWDMAKQELELHHSILQMLKWPFDKTHISFDELFEIIHPSDLKYFKDRLELLRSDDAIDDPFDIRIIEQGELKVVLRCKGLVSRRDSSNQPCGAVGTCIDVTDYRVNFELLGLQRDLAMLMSETGDLQDLLQRCVETIKSKMSIGFVCIYVQSEDNPDKFKLVAKTEGREEVLSHLETVDVTIMKKLNIDLSKPMYIPYQSLIDVGVIPKVALEYQTVGIIPFLLDNSLYGGIAVASKATGELDVQFKTSLESLGHQMAALFKKINVEKRLKESERHYRTLYENMTQGMALHKLIYDDEDRLIDYTLVEANQAYMQIMNLEKVDSIIRKNASSVFGVKKIPFLKELDRVFKSQKPMRVSRYQPFIGKHVGLSFYMFDSRHIALLIHDESDEKRLERQMLHSQKMEAISRLSGGIAHDFNNLLQVIFGYTEIAKSIPGASNCAENIMTAARSAMDLVRKLSIFDSVTSSSYENVYVEVVLQATLKMMSWLVEQSIHVEVEGGQTTLPVYANPSMIEQVFINLCMNSRDAMPEGGIIRFKTDLVSLNEKYANSINLSSGQYVRVTMTDTGKGVPDEISEKIFDPFFTTKPFGDSSGLGLSTVYVILQRLGGSIELIKTEKNGSNQSGAVFRIYLPVSTQSPVQEKTEPQKVISDFKDTQILLAEDDLNVRELLVRVLNSAGHSVITASNGPEAVIKYRKNADKIQLLILDQIMPGMTGSAVYEMISKYNSRIPVIFSSGYTTEKINPSDYDPDLTIFLSKPYKRDELLAAVQTLISRK